MKWLSNALIAIIWFSASVQPRITIVEQENLIKMDANVLNRQLIKDSRTCFKVLTCNPYLSLSWMDIEKKKVFRSTCVWAPILLKQF